MVFLLDANIIIRFLTADHEEHFLKSKDIFKQIEDGKIEAIILDVVVLESFFVLTKLYKLPKDEVLTDLRSILSLEHIVNSDKPILLETLNLMEYKNIYFVDALICAKTKLQNYQAISFGRDINKKCN